MKKVIFYLLPFFLFISCGSTKVEVYDEPKIMEEPKEESLPIEVERPQEIKKPVEAVKSVPTFTYRNYKIKKRDTYYSIAKQQYGNRHLWPCIYYANLNKYPNPDFIQPKTTIKIPVINSISAESTNIKFSMIKAYERYVKQISLQKNKSKQVKNRKRAIGVLVSAELLYPGFMKENSSSINQKHITEARKLLKEKYRK